MVLVARMPFKCPAAPYEATLLLDHDLRKRKVRSAISVALYTPEPGPMGVAGPQVSAGVQRLVEERDIGYYTQHQVEEVDAKAGILRFSNGAEAQYDFLVYVPPHIAPPAVEEAGLTEESGWVPVDCHTMETRFPGVYAIGGVSGIPLTMGLPLPKAGVFAHRQGQMVARTIAAQINGNGRAGVFEGEGENFIEVGAGKAGFGRGNFYSEPVPSIKLHQPGRRWHMGKVLFERGWLRRWF